MAVYKRDLVDINLETGNIHRSFLKHSIGYKDQQADHFGIRAYRDGEPVNLTGISVQGVFMPPQGDPIAITSGNIVDGNVAEVVLPQACYNYDGQFTLAIKLVDSTNSVTGTVRIVDGMVDNTHASGTVAPTSAVPTYQEVLSAYEQAIAVIGNSVRFDQSQSLTDTQKGTARTNIAAASESELSDVKSAIDQYYFVRTSNSNGGYINTSGEIGSVVDMTPTSSASFIYFVSDCKTGNMFKINGTGGGNGRLWCFIDKDNKIISHAAASAVGTDMTLVAPANGKLIVNTTVNSNGYLKELVPFVRNGAENMILNTMILEKGGINNSGEETTNQAYVRTKNYIYGTGYIALKEDIQVRTISYYDKTTLAHVGTNSSPMASNCTFGKDGCVCRIVLQRTDGANLSVEDAKSSFVLEQLQNQTNQNTAMLEKTAVLEDCLIYNDGGYVVNVNTGEISTSTSSYLIHGKIDGYDIIIFNGSSYGNDYGIAFYDEDNDFISGVKTTTDGAIAVPIPTGAVYFKACYRFSQQTNNTVKLGRYVYNNAQAVSDLNDYYLARKQQNASYYFPKSDFCEMETESDIPAWTSGQNALSVYYDLYDGLVEDYPNYVTKIDVDAVATAAGITRPSALNDYPIYAYRFAPKNTPVEWEGNTTFEKRPLIFITTGTHPEYMAIYSTYIMMKNICTKWSTSKPLECLRHHAEFIIMPCSSPTSVENATYTNYNGVNVNRNMPVHDFKVQGAGTENYTGASAGSEYESKVLVKMLADYNPDVYIDHHNSFTSPIEAWYNMMTKDYISEMAHLGIIETTKMKAVFPDKFPSWDDNPNPLVEVKLHGNNYGRGIRCVYGYEQGFISFTMETMQYCRWKDGQLYEEYQDANSAKLVGIATNVVTNTCLLICQLLAEKKLY